MLLDALLFGSIQLECEIALVIFTPNEVLTQYASGKIFRTLSDYLDASPEKVYDNTQHGAIKNLILEAEGAGQAINDRILHLILEAMELRCDRLASTMRDCHPHTHTRARARAISLSPSRML